MIFPISVSFNKSLKTTITSDNKEQILECIKKSILDDNADCVLAEDMSVRYKGSTSAWRGSLFGNVDDGIFHLLNKNNRWFLSYRINMRTLFVSTAIMSIFAGVFALVTNGPWWIGIAAFLWLCGANWIINLIRHESVASNLAVAIDELMRDKEQHVEHDKFTAPLKSWF